MSIETDCNCKKEIVQNILKKQGLFGLFKEKAGVNLIKLFWCKFTHFFRKLEHFMAMQQILLMLIKWSSLQKRVSKFTPKLFFEIGPSIQKN
jgi:hypothetical protein